MVTFQDRALHRGGMASPPFRSARAFIVVILTLAAACSPPSSDEPAPQPGQKAVATSPPPKAADPVVKDGPTETRTGIASFIDNRLNGRKTASGEVYDGSRLVAAHPSYPLGTRLRVTNLENGRTVEVTVVDRSPSGANRPIVDLSRAAAEQLGFVSLGRVKVTTDVLARQTPY